MLAVRPSEYVVILDVYTKYKKAYNKYSTMFILSNSYKGKIYLSN
jgi:hypothetical protein